MPKKTHLFQRAASPVKIGIKENTANKSKNFSADWFRFAKQKNVLLNGIPLSDYASEYNEFKNESDVEQFLKEVVIFKLHLSPEKSASALAFFKDYFHQQGFMNPVSTPLSYYLIEAGKSAQTPIALTTSSAQTENVYNMSVGPEGFSIQELVTVKQVLVSPINGGAGVYLPKLEENKEYAIKAEGKLHFDFRADASNPKITVKSNKISAMDSQFIPLSTLFTPEGFWEKLWENIARVLGWNKAEVLEAEPVQVEAPIEEDSTEEDSLTRIRSKSH